MPTMPNGQDIRLVPGLDAVGHGIYLRPHDPYELRGILFPHEDYRAHVMMDFDQPLAIPAGYEVDDSPPMPSGQLLNQVKIEESWDRFSKQIALNAKVAASNGSFSVSAGSTTQLRADEEAYYATRSSFIPMWSVYLTDPSRYLPDLDDYELPPPPFRYRYRNEYETFFRRYGSHFVKRVWVGGKATLFFTVFKSANLSKQDIRVGLQAGAPAIGVEGSMTRNESRERLLSNSACSVVGRGGNELRLASLSSLDEAAYNAWVESVRANPQVIELEVSGVWTLVKNLERAQALADAYQALNVFRGFSASFAIDKTVYFLRGDEFLTYDIKEGRTNKPEELVCRWPDFERLGIREFDAAFSTERLRFASGEDQSRKVHLFFDDMYIRLDMDTDKVDLGPVPFAEAWPGVPFPRIDAAVGVRRDTVYFFCGNEYVRFNTLRHCVDPGYPQPINKRWKGVVFDRIDAVLNWTNGKIYFFKDDQYIRYDMVTYEADAGYPRAMVGDYVEDWQFIE